MRIISLGSVFSGHNQTVSNSTVLQILYNFENLRKRGDKSYIMRFTLLNLVAICRKVLHTTE